MGCVWSVVRSVEGVRVVHFIITTCVDNKALLLSSLSFSSFTFTSLSFSLATFPTFTFYLGLVPVLFWVFP